MAEFVAELYVARTDTATAGRNAELAREAAEEMAREGTAVLYVRSLFMPEDETCFLIYEAASAEAVFEAVGRAALPVERVVASVAVNNGDEGGTR